MSYYATTHYLQRVYSTFCLMNKWCNGINRVSTSFFKLNSSLFKTIYIKKWILWIGATLPWSLVFASKTKKKYRIKLFFRLHIFSSTQYKTVQHKSKSIRQEATVKWGRKNRLSIAHIKRGSSWSEKSLFVTSRTASSVSVQAENRVIWSHHNDATKRLNLHVLQNKYTIMAILTIEVFILAYRYVWQRPSLNSSTTLQFLTAKKWDVGCK